MWKEVANLFLWVCPQNTEAVPAAAVGSDESSEASDSVATTDTTSVDSNDSDDDDDDTEESVSEPKLVTAVADHEQ